MQLTWQPLIQLVALAFFLHACANDDDRIPEREDGCPGDAPSLSSCFVGFGFVECGGTGEPAFACDSLGDCTWFSDGCVAQGYVASPCPWTRLCCIDGWPFEQGVVESPSRVTRVFETFGRIPWNRTRAANIVVTIDSELEVVPPSVNCSPPGDLHGPCQGKNVRIRGETKPFMDSHLVRFQDGTYDVPLSGSYLDLEILPTEGGSNARACFWGFSDVESPGPECPDIRFSEEEIDENDSSCAQSGTLVLTADPSSGNLHGRLHAEFEGRVVDATF